MDCDPGEHQTRYLLHLSYLPRYRYKKMMMAHLLNVAKACIPALWKQALPRTIALWFSKIAELHHMKNIMATLDNVYML